MRISLIGAGDIDFHFNKLLGINNKNLNIEIEKIAKSLVRADVELCVLPDRGVCFEVCKKYKEFGGKKVIATVPRDDKEYGIKHLQKYLEEEINGKKVIDDVINSGDWYKENMSHILFADKVLMLGTSLGSLGELSFGYYLFKLFKGHKTGVKINLKKINKYFLAGEKTSFDTIIYSPFIKEKLPFEIEMYIESCGGKVTYVSTPNQINGNINKL